MITIDLNNNTLSDTYDYLKCKLASNDILFDTGLTGVMFYALHGSVLSKSDELYTGSEDVIFRNFNGAGATFSGTIEFLLQPVNPSWKFDDITINIDYAGELNLKSSEFIGDVVLDTTNDSVSTVLLPYGTAYTNNDPVNITVIVASDITIENTNILAESSVRLFNETQNSELDLQLLITESGYSYSTQIGDGQEVNVGDVIRIDALKSDGLTHYKYFTERATATVNGIQYVESQELWEEAIALGIDGSIQTEFILDGLNIQIDINSPDPYFSVAAGISWGIWVTTTTENGIRYFFGALKSLDEVHWTITTGKVDMWLDNLSPDTVKQIDGTILERDDGKYPQIPVTTGGGGISLIQSLKVSQSNAIETADAVWSYTRG